MAKLYTFRTKDKKLADWLDEVFGEDVDSDCHILTVISNDESHKFTYYNCDQRQLRELTGLSYEGYLDMWMRSHIDNYLEYIN